MASETAVIILTLVGIGVIVVGVLILMSKDDEKQPRERIIVEKRPYYWNPYLRPVLLG
jgi:hypothetical protein